MLRNSLAHQGLDARVIRLTYLDSCRRPLKSPTIASVSSLAKAAEPFLTTNATETAPSFSPDGRWLAYDIQDSTGEQVFVRRYRPGVPAGEGGKWQISSGANGNFPMWSPIGKQLFYRSIDAHIMVVDYTISGDTFSPSRPREWSPGTIFMTGVFQN
jgi:dipeptidyl aminopeptidase/acylaminoacyl peptidase